MGIEDAVPYRRTGQLVEQHNEIIKKSLVAYCDNHRDWNKHVPEIALAMHTSEIVGTGYTSAFFCYGLELRTFWEPVKTKSDSESSTTAVNAFAAGLTQCPKDAVNIAREKEDAARSAEKQPIRHPPEIYHLCGRRPDALGSTLY